MHVRYPWQAYEFEIQPFEEYNKGGVGQWAPVNGGYAKNDENEAQGASPLITATGLSSSTSYRFRVHTRHNHGVSRVSGISEVFTTGNLYFVRHSCRLLDGN